MVVGPRAALAVFAAGFGLEAVGGIYVLLQPADPLGGSAVLFVAPVIAGFGVLLLWLGMGSWRARRPAVSRAIRRTFAGATAALVFAGLPFLWQLANPVAPLPDWAPWEFAAAIALGWTLTFVMYGLIGLRQRSSWARAVVLGAIVWAGGVSVWLGLALAGPLPAWTSAAVRGTFSPSSIASAAAVPLSYLAPSYLLLFVVYLSMIVRLSLRPSRRAGEPTRPATS